MLAAQVSRIESLRHDSGASLRLGVEQEFDLLDGERQLDFQTLFARAITRVRSVPFRNSDSAAILEAGYMLGCDGKEAEFATAPISLRGGGPMLLAREVTRCRVHMLGLLRGIGVREVQGYSTHLSISVPPGRERDLAEAISITVAPALILLMEAKASPGMLLRTRRGRLEIGSEYIDDEQQLAAAAVLLAGVVHAILFNEDGWGRFPRLRLRRWEEATIRPGIYLPRDAYGECIHEQGRLANLELEDGRVLSAGALLERCTELVARELDGLVDQEAIEALRQVAGQAGTLQIDGDSDPGHIASRPAHSPAPESATLTLLARGGARRLSPRFVDWEGAAFEWRNSGNHLVLGVPWAHLPALFTAAQHNRISSLIPGGTAAQPMLNSLDQLESPQTFQAVDASSLGSQAVGDKGTGGGKGAGGGKGGVTKPPAQLSDSRRYVPRPRFPWRRIGWLIPVIILIITTIIFVRRAPSVPDDSVPQRSLTSTPPRPVQTYVRETPQVCGLEILTTIGPDGVPVQGPLNMEWSRAKGAFSYELELSQPEGAGNPWVVTTDKESKAIFMENFPAGGKYKLTVGAYDAYGKLLCSTGFEFEKEAAGNDPNRGQPGEGDGAGECNVIGPCPP